mgnify:CR=1 FL=1
MLASKIFSAKSYSGNAGNRICVNVDVKIVEGKHGPDLLVSLAPSALEFCPPPPKKKNNDPGYATARIML